MVVTFGLLGSLVVHDGTELRPVTGPKVRVLLAALLLQANRPVSRDALKAALWGASVPASADAALANHLTRLRRILATPDHGPEERLRTVAPGYQLLVHDGELDADVFEARVRAVRHAHRQEDWEEVRRETALAMPLWRGTPWPTWPPSPTPRGRRSASTSSRRPASRPSSGASTPNSTSDGTTRPSPRSAPSRRSTPCGRASTAG